MRSRCILPILFQHGEEFGVLAYVTSINVSEINHDCLMSALEAK